MPVLHVEAGEPGLVDGRNGGHHAETLLRGHRIALDRSPDRVTGGGYAPDVLQAAIYFVGASTDFTGALEQSLAFAGPDN